MKILVTGGAGFIGSHVVDAFVEAGHDVVVVDHQMDESRRNVNEKARYIWADMVSDEAIQEMQNNTPDVLCHLAAQISVPQSVADPEFDAQENVHKPTKLLMAARNAGVKLFVNTSSCAVYGEPAMIPLSEFDQKNPISPYGKHKLLFEEVLLASDIRTISFRPANVYGPRQTTAGEAGVVAIFLERFLEGKDVQIFGDGNATRDFVYVGDIAQAFLLAAESEAKGIFNLGTQTETSVHDLWRAIQALDPKNPAEAVHKDARPGDIEKSCLNYAPAKGTFNWQPNVELAEGLQKTYDWFKQL